MEKVRKHIIFHGTVQGVGFRYTAYYAAQSVGVTGWVRNLYDGTVEAEAEGTQADIDMMIAAIKRGRFIEIDSMDISEIPLKGDAVFNIR
ncbi:MULTISPECIES: acylphosphatase [Ruminococcus]|uniref:acylphosphatase n=2 Tax=Ruminococcus TaxID=1263 RepID=E9S7Z1_RUMAL|nr:MULTISPECIES: acylphosphatase [Ruminococcus]MBE6873668.1 acylphosphatase [Ruminococcus albus]EGC04597.1 acylphosphatase [Ruminococcus albus 8]MBO5557949.1 acylphosphatase [Ruminococcus sp.]MBR0530159.1 acylphosphatase [Ruminococcus sp.]MCC3351344.1 acylphosphatase [Ruminococcus albus 8]